MPQAAPHENNAWSPESGALSINWDEIVQFPVGRIAPDLLAKTADEVKAFVQANHPLTPIARHKPHLLLPSVYDLGQSPDILKGVRKFLGTDDFFQMYSVLFVKEKNTEGYIPWHYDDYFWGLNCTNGCTAWVALGDVTVDNGAMEFVPGGTDAARLYVQFETNNMLVRGNNSTFEPKPGDEHRFVELKAGEFSVHSHNAWHRSGPNRSPNDRLAVAFRFITNDAAPKKFAALGRGGVPRQGRSLPAHFYVERCPTKPLSVGMNWQHKRSILTASFLINFGDTTRGFWAQSKDLLSMATKARFFRLIGDTLRMLVGGKKNGVASSPAARGINDG